PGRVAPEQREVPTRNEAAPRRIRDRAAQQAVKRVPDRDELEGTFRVDILGATGDPANVVDTLSPRLRATELDRLGFLIDRPDFDEARPEAERDLAGATREIQQPAGTRDPGPDAQVVEQWFGV